MRAALLAIAVSPSPALAWAPLSQATDHPGVQVFTEGAQCTSNFVYQGAGDIYLGQAAHCSGTGASKPGTLVYNSRLTMQAKGETDPDTCAYNISS